MLWVLRVSGRGLTRVRFLLLLSSLDFNNLLYQHLGGGSEGGSSSLSARALDLVPGTAWSAEH